jgi:hypothetical protein
MIGAERKGYTVSNKEFPLIAWLIFLVAAVLEVELLTQEPDKGMLTP